MNIEATSSTNSTTSSSTESKSSTQATYSEKSFKDEIEAMKQESSNGQGEEDCNENQISSLYNKNSSGSKDSKDIAQDKMSADPSSDNKNLTSQNIISKTDVSSVLNKSQAQKDFESSTSKSDIENDVLATNLQAMMDMNAKFFNLNSQSRDKDSLSAVHQKNGFSLESSLKSVQMDENDAMFFANIVQNKEIDIQNIGIKDFATLMTAQQTPEAQKSAQVSATLLNSLSEAAKNNQPLRIDFDNDIAVILKVDKSGKVSADFIPGDKAVEEYLKSNIPLLKQRFEEQNLAYGDLSYRQSKQQKDNENNDKNNNKRNKENDNE